jgi:type VI secretion system protein ImpH
VAGTDGHADRRLMFLEALRRVPERFDFYQAMRRIEAGNPALPRLGEARRPSAEPLRLAQEAELAFAVANLTRVDQTRSGLPRVSVRFLGLFGPQGPLPLHLTEFVRDRERNHGDASFARFADIFHHRLLLMFYRAWRQAQPAATHDRPAEDRYRTYIGALFGHGSAQWQRPELELAQSKRHFAGHLGRAARHPEALAAIMEGYFGVPVRVQTFSPRWMRLPSSQQSSLGGVVGAAAGANGLRGGGAGFRGNDSAILGQSAVIGSRVLDAQHHFDIHVGPLGIESYERLLPGGDWLAKAREWVREYCGDEFGVRLVPHLEARAVPAMKLGHSGRLGWNSWVGRRRSDAPASDLSLPVATAPAGI